MTLDTIPDGVKGWSWGAFFLGGFWAASNKTWIGLLSFVPIVGFIMAFVLGSKGREWAWKNNQWDSLEHFNRVQKKWSFWGVTITLLACVIGIAIAIPAYQNYQQKTQGAIAATMNEASVQQQQAVVSPQVKTNDTTQQPASPINTTETRFGTLAVKKMEDNFKKSIVLLPNVLLIEIEDDLLSVEEVYQMAGEDVVMVEHNCGGSACSYPSISFITLRADGTHSVSKWFDTSIGTKPVRVGDKLVLDLGYNQGKQETLTYANGDVAIQANFPSAGEAGDPEICKWLYQDLYVQNIEQERCDENPCDIGGMSTARECNRLLNDPHFNLDRLENRARYDCENKKIMAYEVFKQQICKR